jgi:hypothetical protein
MIRTARRPRWSLRRPSPCRREDRADGVADGGADAPHGPIRQTSYDVMNGLDWRATPHHPEHSDPARLWATVSA